MPRAERRERRPGPSFARLLVLAAGGPFGNAREMVVIAVARLPHRTDQRTIRRLRLREPRDHNLQSSQRLVGVEISSPVLEFDELAFARRVASAQRHIGDLADGSRCQILEAALPQDRALKRQLRRQAGAYLWLGRRRTGFVIEDRKRAVSALLDTVGARCELECPYVDW